MVRPFRIRRIAKWMGVSICALIVGAWAVSERYGCFLPIGQSVFLELEHGALDIMLGTSVVPPPGLHVRAQHWNEIGLREPMIGLIKPNWWTTQTFRHVRVPLLHSLFVAFVVTLLLFRIDQRRIVPGHCADCRYNLTGNTSGVCPECGSKIARERSGKS